MYINMQIGYGIMYNRTVNTVNQLFIIYKPKYKLHRHSIFVQVNIVIVVNLYGKKYVSKQDGLIENYRQRLVPGM